MSCYSREQIEDAMAAKGYKYFDGGDFDVNIIGVRNSETKNRVTNAFDDCITLSYREDGEWKFHCYKCTTDPVHTGWVTSLTKKEWLFSSPDNTEVLIKSESTKENMMPFVKELLSKCTGIRTKTMCTILMMIMYTKVSSV